jgi:CHAT domain
MNDDPFQLAMITDDVDFIANVINALVRFLSKAPSTDPRYEVHLSNLAALYYRWSGLTGDMRALETAVEIQRGLVGSESADRVNYVANCINLGRTLTTLYERNEDAALLEEAVAVLRAAVGMSADPGHRLPAMSNLGSALYALYGARGDIEDCRQAAGLFQEVAGLTEAGHPMRYPRLIGLADARRDLFYASPDPGAFERAVTVHRQLRAALPREHPDRPRMLSNLAYLLGTATGDPGASSFDESRACYRESVELTAPDSPQYFTRLSSLGSVIGEIGWRDGDVDALQEAVGILQTALSGLPAEAEIYRLTLEQAGRCLVRAFSLDGRTAHLDTVLAMLAEAMEKIPPGHPARYEAATALGAELADHQRLAESAKAWELAASAARTAGQRAAAVSSQAAVLMQLYDIDRDEQTLNEAISLSRLALQVGSAGQGAAAGEDDQLGLLANLASALFRRMDRGIEAEVAEVGTLLAGVVLRTPASHPRYLRRISMLGSVVISWLGFPSPDPERPRAVETLLSAAERLSAAQLRELDPMLPLLNDAFAGAFRRNEDQALLATVIRVGRLLISSRAPDDTTLVTHFPNLAMPLAIYTETTNDSAAREELIALCERVIGLLPEGDLDRLQYQGMLAMILERQGSPRLEDTVDDFIDKVTNMMADDPARALLLPPLAAALGDRAGGFREKISELSDQREELRRALAGAGLADARRIRYERELADVAAERDFQVREQSVWLEKAIQAHRQIDADPQTDSRLRRLNLSNLAYALWDKYLATENDAAIAEAIATMRKALDGMDEPDPDRMRLLLNFGRLLRDAAEAGDREEIAAEAADVYATVANAPSLPPRMRADGAAWWGYMARKLGDLPTALNGLALAVGLLDEVAWRGLSRQDQESLLADYGTIAVDAAAVAIELGQPERAVELLEQGRSVLLAQMLGTRANYDRLNSRAPELAAELVRIESELSAAVEPAGALLLPGEPVRQTRLPAAQRAGLVARRQQVLEEIRRLPGLDEFLLPPRYASLARAAEEGPVAIINISEIRCDALVITKDFLRLIPLSGISRDGVREVAQVFLVALRAVSLHGPDEYAENAVHFTLAWMNKHIAGPVLDAIEDFADSDDATALPRVWWCPTGWLSFLPLHVAGQLAGNANDAPRAVFDRVISSYTPTLGALIYSRSAKGSDKSNSPRELMVAMPETPGMGDLPNVHKEVEDYRNTYPGAAVLEGEQAVRDAVAEGMRQCSLVHFACHGGQGVGQSAASCVYLADGPLSIAEINRLQIASGELAFLSACATAQVSSRLTDESLTVSSAMLLAGFRHVIGTLWYIYDPLAPLISGRFYEILQEQGDGEMDAAGALHKAVAAVRARYPDRPLLWAQYIHVGA